MILYCLGEQPVIVLTLIACLPPVALDGHVVSIDGLVMLTIGVVLLLLLLLDLTSPLTMTSLLDSFAPLTKSNLIFSLQKTYFIVSITKRFVRDSKHLALKLLFSTFVAVGNTDASSVLTVVPTKMSRKLTMKALMLTEMNVILLAWRSPPMLMKKPKRRRKELERLLWKVPLKPSALAT